MGDFKPTAEQVAAMEAYATGEDLIIEAGAGTGKTSSLKLLANHRPHRKVQYIAFNRAIVEEAKLSMPKNVKAATAHSLAYRAVGCRYRERLSARRMRSTEIAHRLGIEPLRVPLPESKSKTLAPGYLAGLAMRAITQFCQSADDAPKTSHVPYIDGIDEAQPNGARGMVNNNRVRRHILPTINKAWSDIQKTDGALQFKHEHYLKMWQLSRPFIACDAIFFDEAQDVSPVLAAIVGAQKHAQRVYVGDSNQAIYAWLGAVDALAQMDAAHRTTLTQSFRFGPAVAEVANRALAELPTDMVMRGTPTIDSSLGNLIDADAILCRNNATAVEMMLDERQRNRRAHLLGGGKEVISFAYAALDLQDEKGTQHQDLACFETWDEVRDYVDEDAQGEELKLLVKLVDRFGARGILYALNNQVEEKRADVVISTAHKSKGRQWKRVRLADDFPDKLEETSDDELRLLYVAVTRAEHVLDAGSVPWVIDGDASNEQAEVATLEVEAVPA